MRQMHPSGLEQRHPLGAVGEVEAGGVQQASQQGRPHRRLFARERIAELDQVPPGVVAGKPQAVADARVGEAPADDLVGAQVAHHVLGPPPQRLLAGQAAHRRDRRQRRRQVLVEVGEPRHLLDQVGLALHVGVALRRHGGDDLVAAGLGLLALDAEAERLEACGAGVAVDRHPDQRLDPRHAQRHLARLGLVDRLVDRPRHQLGAGQLDQQPRGDVLGAHRQRRVQLLLEPRRGLGAQRQLARGAQDVDPVPGRDLQQHPGRRLGHLRCLPAHHARRCPRACRGRRPAPPRDRTPAPPRRASSSSRPASRCG